MLPIMKQLLLLLFIASTFLFAQSEKQVDSLLYSIKNYKPEQMSEAYNKLLAVFENKDSVRGRQAYDRIMNYLTGLDDKSLYIRLYLNSERFYPFKEKLRIFERGYEMARSNGNENLMGIADMMRGFAFKDHAITDSAMIYALRAKTIFERVGNNYDLVNVLLIIADLHYWAGRLGKAEELYKEIIVKKGDPHHWKSWRYSVVLNDLGLVKIKQGKYTEAEEYFMNSLNYISSDGLNHNDSTRLAYIYRMLFDVNLLIKNYEKAEAFYLKSLTFAQKFGQVSELPALYIGRGELFYAKGKYDSALVYFRKAELYELKSTDDIYSRVSLYRGFTNTYTALNNIRQAHSYMILLRKAENRSDSLFHRAKYMNLYAEYNYANYLDQINDYKRHQIILLTIIIIILSSLSSITYYYLRLRKANLKLVKKNIELALSSRDLVMLADKIEASSSETELNDEVKTNGLDKEIINDIVGRLEELMINEKLYFDSNLSLDKLADCLETNRAYLSKAINARYSTNFNNYINAFRIKETVKFISVGDHKVFNIEGLAQRAGFNNRVSFSKAFRKYTGVTPSFFIKNAE